MTPAPRLEEDAIPDRSAAPRFTTLFLLKAMAVTAFCCAPMLLNEREGFVWTAFLLPAGLLVLVAIENRAKTEWRVDLVALSESVVDLRVSGGLYGLWTQQARTLCAAFCASLAFGFPALHQVDPEPIAMWLPVVVALALTAIVLLGCSIRRRIHVEQSLLVTDVLVFRRVCVFRSRWRAKAGDSLAITRTFSPDTKAPNATPAFIGLWVFHSDRQGPIVFGAQGCEPKPTFWSNWRPKRRA